MGGWVGGGRVGVSSALFFPPAARVPLLILPPGAGVLVLVIVLLVVWCVCCKGGTPSQVPERSSQGDPGGMEGLECVAGAGARTRLPTCILCPPQLTEFSMAPSRLHHVPPLVTDTQARLVAPPPPVVCPFRICPSLAHLEVITRSSPSMPRLASAGGKKTAKTISA